MERFWVLWFAAVLVGVFGTFGLMEAHAIRTNQSTLSRTVWEITKAWPPFGFSVGALVVGPMFFLACHFFWPGQGCVIN